MMKYMNSEVEMMTEVEERITKFEDKRARKFLLFASLR